ncbi:DUF5691 domain-containing protein [Gallaecimonas xiamenensis]|uniref:Uncharacterized protein n=1 Tax=Gallaecimonas xiamenensis 3-C-1 TaxID=745411 RepID=K2KKB2_9GAMM|nr:DUF5691 domain-containing protein [Gallaecimonas xiamenensis]EKE77825.1 hypothetical protein B3C1_00155 [Gallaecimonas xiamenensis 3-C-1]
MLNQDTLGSLDQQTEKLLMRWAMGHNGLPEADLPPHWLALLQDLPAPQQASAALALLSQVQAAMLAISPPAQLKVSAAIPLPALPLLPTPLRPLFRRCLGQPQGYVQATLALLERRGYAPHPADWFVEQGDQVQLASVQPWYQWRDETRDNKAPPEDTLSQDNWDAWPPQQRLAQCQALRRQDPAQARVLLMACAAKEKAANRQRLLECLADNLSSADAPYLTELLGDRAEGIRLFAQRMLLRLDCLPKDQQAQQQAQALELAAGFEVKSTGLLRRSKELIPQKLKSSRKAADRTQLLATTSPRALAEALQLTLAELVTAWSFQANSDDDNLVLVEQLRHSLDHSLLGLLLDRLFADIDGHGLTYQHLRLLRPLTEAMDSPQRQQLALRLLASQEWEDDLDFEDIGINLRLDSLPLGKEDFLALPRWRRFCQELGQAIREEEASKVQGTCLDLAALGLWLPRNTATAIIEQLTGLGLSYSDPLLNHLKFNVALAQAGTADMDNCKQG